VVRPARAALLAIAFAAAGCELIAGLGDRSHASLAANDGGEGDDGSGGASVGGAKGAGFGGAKGMGGASDAGSSAGGSVGAGGSGSATGGSGGGTGGAGLGGSSSAAGGASGGGSGGVPPPDAAVPPADMAPRPPDASPAATWVSEVCPSCEPIYDGKTLDGWTPSPAGSWTGSDGVVRSMHVRGYVATSAPFGDFRLLFRVRHVEGAHEPGMLFFGHTAPPSDALGALQLQVPNGSMWDYRPGIDMAPPVDHLLRPNPAPVPLSSAEWNQCEVLVRGSEGTLALACCTPNGDRRCVAHEVVRFRDSTVPKMGPIGIQCHNSGIVDEYKDLFIERNPPTSTLVTTQ
jgi:hypothetical protein